MSSDLTPLDPSDGVEMYLNHRESELSEKSLLNQRYRLASFLSYCEEEGIDNLNDVTGRDLHAFRVWRANGDGDDYDDVSAITLRSVLATLRTALEFWASVDAVPQGMREKVTLPDLDDEDASRNEQLETDRALAVLDHLDTFHYASREHVVMAIVWHTGVRLGTLRSFDVRDFHYQNRAIDVRHRSETGTPLKNGSAAERSIAIGDHYAKVIRDYIDTNRPEVHDDHGREPLIASDHGRLTATPIRRLVNRWTQPCRIGDCPHGKDVETCEWADYESLAGCPSSRSPHAVRRGSITEQLRSETPEEIVSVRANATLEVLDQHYDERTESERREQRRQFVYDA